MIKIRLSRTGPRKKPFFRIVAIDEKRKNKSRALDVLGFWQPKKDNIKINKDKLKMWLEKGAKTTSAVDKLL